MSTGGGERSRRVPVKAADRRGAGAPERRGGGPGASKRKTESSGISQLGGTLAAKASHVSPRTIVWLLLAALFLCLSISPVSRNLEATTRLHRIKAELDEQKAVTSALEREVAEAESLEYIEREARRQRLVAPGEVLYLVTTEGEEKVEFKIKAIQSMDEAWERVREMLHSNRRGPDEP
ncbi:MAG: septum formation initiator family protein [Actinomycetota bacterium]